MPRAAIKARIVAIGNSQGIRIPKPLLAQAGLAAEVPAFDDEESDWR
jgi:hypothetical protein